MDNQSETTPTVIARASKTFIVIVALFIIPALITASRNLNVVTITWAILHVAIVLRVTQIRVDVSKSRIRITNFFRTTEVPIWEAEIDVREETETIMLSDAGGRMDRSGRMLYIRRPWHGNEEVHVGVAPRFGAEFDRIHNELESAIKLYRAA